MMRTFATIIILSVCLAGFGQTVLNSPSEARLAGKIDYRNIEWTQWQNPHYYTGYSVELLEQDAYLEADMEEIGEVLFEKINIYREIMGKNRLMLNDTGSRVCLEYARELATSGKFTHTLHGRTPTDRMRPFFPYRIEASENLNQIGCSLKDKNDSVDEFTDMTLHCWINSKGHNTNLLNDGEIGAIGVYTHIDKRKNEQSTVAVFSILYRR